MSEIDCNKQNISSFSLPREGRGGASGGASGEATYLFSPRGEMPAGQKGASVMGILNVTPDSFFAGSRMQTEKEIHERAEEIIQQGGTIIDVGAVSTRPGSEPISEDEEMSRLRFALPIVRSVLDALPMDKWGVALSVDTFRANVANMAIEEYGADIINDVKGSTAMYNVIAEKKVPYILMSSASTLEKTTEWYDVELAKLYDLGIRNIILDPGYGFGKTIEQSYDILRHQQELKDRYKLPLLVGVSRKRMVWQLLGTTPQDALNGTTALNILALERGADILRVHDVREAVEAVKIYNYGFSE